MKYAFKQISEEEWRAEQEAKCRVKRGPRATTICEYPRGHDGLHFGRSQCGRWFSWPLNPAETTAKLES